MEILDRKTNLKQTNQTLNTVKHSTLVNNKGNQQILSELWYRVAENPNYPFFKLEASTAAKEDADKLYTEIHWNITEVWAKTAEKIIETYNSTSEYGKEEFTVFTKIKRDDTIVDRIGIWN